MGDETERGESIRTGLWTVKLLVVGGWTALCGLALLILFLAFLDAGDSGSGDGALGACAMMGCTGGGWFCGMLAIVVVFAAIRR